MQLRAILEQEQQKLNVSWEVIACFESGITAQVVPEI